MARHARVDLSGGTEKQRFFIEHLEGCTAGGCGAVLRAKKFADAGEWRSPEAKTMGQRQRAEAESGAEPDARGSWLAASLSGAVLRMEMPLPNWPTAGRKSL
jgi:hypothetical protein